MQARYRSSFYFLIGCFLATVLLLGSCKKNPVNSESHSLESPTLLLQGKSSTGSYVIRWTKSIGNYIYELHEDDTPSFVSPSAVYTGHDTMTSISNKSFGTTFYYRVRAIKSTDTSSWSATRTISIVQPVIIDSFYPMQIGNMWQYECYEQAGGTQVGPWYVTVMIPKDTVVGNKTYSLLVTISGTLLGSAARKLARFDSTSGNYYEYDLIQNREYLVDSTRCNSSNSFYWGTLSILSNYSIFGTVTTARRFYQDYNPTFYDRYFAREFGFVRLYYVGFRSMRSEQLVYAIIAGNEYGSPTNESGPGRTVHIPLRDALIQ